MKRSPASDPPEVSTQTKPLAPGDIVEIECSDLIAKSGQAVGRAGGMVIYVLGPIPGERARVRIELVKTRYATAELIELITRSPDRVEPFCTVFGACGGCQIQHLSYPAQLLWKRGLVANALRRIGGIADARVAATIAMAEPRAYRNKMALVVDRSEEGTSFGFYAAGSHDVVPIATCPIVEKPLDRCIPKLWEAASTAASSPAFAGARHVVARSGRAGKTVLSITSDRAWRGPAASVEALARLLPGVAGIVNTYEPSSANAIVGRRKAALHGDVQVEEAIDELRFRVSPASFFQVNTEIVAKIFEFLKPQLPRLRRVADLYCGAGTFSLLFARGGASVVGVDENGAAIREARANAALNRLEAHTTFLAERVESAVRKKTLGALGGAPDLMFLDPPRKGVDPGALRAIAALRVPHLWYLSCDPATLARDLAQLTATGYLLDGVQPFDMFPQTGHVEALAVLRRSDAEALALPFLEVQ